MNATHVLPRLSFVLVLLSATSIAHAASGPRHGGGGGDDVVSIGHDSHLREGEKADSVVSVFGSSTSEGEAVDVVSVLGNSRVSGPVHGDVVAVLGNVYIDSKVEGDAVAVLGSVQLGPHAQIDGDVTSVLGAVHRAPEAIIGGAVHDVFLWDFGELNWLQTWIHSCLLEARPLAFVPGIEWAWSIACVFLGLYFLLALLFPSGISQCVDTLETQPGHSALAALLAILLTPVLLVLLCITLIGIAALPFVVITLFCLSLFGKAVVLAWLGHRILGPRARSGAHPAVAVLIGGGIALLLYVIPVLGFMAYKLLGFFGVGAVVYTILLGQRARQAARAERTPDERGRRDAAPGAAAAAGPGPGDTAAPVGGALFTQSPAAAAADAPRGMPPGAPDAAESGDVNAAAAATAAAATGAAATGFAATGAATGAAASASAGAPPPLLAALPRAGFWLRMGALLIDVLLIGLLTQSSDFFFGSYHHQSNMHLLVLAAYGACMWKLRGSTVGGIVCDLRVVRVDGRPIEWETAIVRALGCFLSLAVCGLGFIWIAFDHNRQAWHDKIAGTVVVRVPKDRAPMAA
jgi:uncharacterized RDD family membrane protein YckC